MHAIIMPISKWHFSHQVYIYRTVGGVRVTASIILEPSTRLSIPIITTTKIIKKM